MLIRKKQGRAGVGPYYWPFDNAIIDVDGDTGYALINLKGGDFEDADNLEWAPSETIPVTSNEIFAWASGNQQRALRALVKEQQAPEPRARLMTFLRNVVNATPDEMTLVTDQDIQDRLAEATSD